MMDALNLKNMDAIIFDWAGTTIDYGSLAPVAVFRSVFSSMGFEITEAEAREPMGQSKIDHIRSILAMPRVSGLWRQSTGSLPQDSDANRLYAQFLQLQKQVLASHSQLIPGVVASVQWLKSQGIKIGSSTGYTRELMEIVLPIASHQGYTPDVCVCSDEVRAGRPAPWLNFRVAELLGVYPMNRVLIVDDSEAGIQAGKNAGCVSVAISMTGNAMGLDQAGVEQLDPQTLASKKACIEQQFQRAGADWVVDSVEHLARQLGM